MTTDQQIVEQMTADKTAADLHLLRRVSDLYALQASDASRIAALEQEIMDLKHNSTTAVKGISALFESMMNEIQRGNGRGLKLDKCNARSKESLRISMLVLHGMVWFPSYHQSAPEALLRVVASCSVWPVRSRRQTLKSALVRRWVRPDTGQAASAQWVS
jgi:hypothetical protein